MVFVAHQPVQPLLAVEDEVAVDVGDEVDVDRARGAVGVLHLALPGGPDAVVVVVVVPEVRDGVEVGVDQERVGGQGAVAGVGVLDAGVEAVAVVVPVEVVGDAVAIDVARGGVVVELLVDGGDVCRCRRRRRGSPAAGRPRRWDSRRRCCR